MKILAIDTSSKVCSVAITENDKTIIKLQNDNEKTHSVKLMPMIDEALKSANLTLKDIDLLVGSVGPGSFTGVRIGISTIKAFADVTNLPVVSVTSLEGLSYNFITNEVIPAIQFSNTLFCSMIDANNSNVYCGLYRYYNGSLNQITDLLAEDINTVISKINTIISTFNTQFSQICFVGDGAILYKDLLEKDISHNNLKFAEGQENDANGVNIAIAGYLKYKNGDFRRFFYTFPYLS